MFTLRSFTALSLLCLANLAFSSACGAVPTRPFAEPQLRALALDEGELPGFSRVAPAGENPPISGVPSPAMTTQDQFWQPYTWAGTEPALVTQPEHFLKAIRRVLYSTDGMYFIEMRIEVCSTEADAKAQLQQFLRGSSAIFSEGTFTGSPVIGNESMFRPADFYGSTLIFRSGNEFVMVSGRQSAGSNRNGGPSYVFPTAAVEAVAYQLLLHASQQPELTGVTAQQVSMDVNGRALPKGALRVAGRVYVPAQAFALAMGLTSRWDARTGALTLSGRGRKTVVVTAGSTAATVGGVVSPALTVPVLKQAGQPVMALEDLLTLTGGHVVGRDGGTVRVKA